MVVGGWCAWRGFWSVVREGGGRGGEEIGGGVDMLKGVDL